MIVSTPNVSLFTFLAVGKLASSVTVSNKYCQIFLGFRKVFFFLDNISICKLWDKVSMPKVRLCVFLTVWKLTVGLLSYLQTNMVNFLGGLLFFFLLNNMLNCYKNETNFRSQKPGYVYFWPFENWRLVFCHIFKQILQNFSGV